MSKQELNPSEYPKRLLIAFARACQDRDYPGPRAHGLPGVLLAIKAGLVSSEEMEEEAYTSSSKR